MSVLRILESGGPSEYWSRFKSRASRSGFTSQAQAEGWLHQNDYLPGEPEVVLEGVFTYLPGEQKRKVVLSLTDICLGLVDDNRMLVRSHGHGPGSSVPLHVLVAGCLVTRAGLLLTPANFPRTTSHYTRSNKSARARMTLQTCSTYWTRIQTAS